MQQLFRETGAKKLLCVMLSLVFVFALAACSKDEDSEPEFEPVPDAAPEPTEEAEAPVGDLDVAFLTGLAKGADYPEGQRAIAVMVNNIAKSRPTRGLSEAQMVFEIKVEGGITRFMALYEDFANMPEVGGVRSARDQFLQIILPFQMFYVHDGPNQNQPTNWMLRDYEYDAFDLQWGTYGGLAWRDQARVAAGYSTEYTEYTDGEHVADVVETHGLDASRQHNSPMFSFVPYSEEARLPEGGAATEVAVVHSDAYRTSFEFRDGKYYMSQFSSSNGSVTPTVDENNDQQLAFDNVLVLFAGMTLYDASELVKVDYYGGGGYYISNGGWESLLWEKGAPDSPLRLLNIDKSGDQVALNPGTTYVAIVDDSLIEDFDNALKSNSAAAVGEGAANANENDSDD